MIESRTQPKPSEKNHGRIKSLFKLKSWRRKSASFLSLSKRTFHKPRTSVSEVSYLKKKHYSVFNPKKRQCSSPCFMTTTPRKGALETNSSKYPKVPLSYINNGNGSWKKHRFRRADTMPSGVIQDYKQKEGKVTLFKRHHSTSYVETMDQGRITRDGTIFAESSYNRRASSAFLTKTKRNSHVPKDMTRNSISYYIPRSWRKKKTSFVPFGSSADRYSYLDDKTRKFQRSKRRFSATFGTPYEKYSTIKKVRERLNGTFGVGQRFKVRKSETCDVKYYCNPYGYPFEMVYKKFSK